jgi:hypothetical protein
MTFASTRQGRDLPVAEAALSLPFAAVVGFT